MDRKQELIAHAVWLIRTRGFDSFSFADLEAHFGIRKASIHHHFRRKEDLGLAVIDALGAFLDQRLPADDPRPAIERLREYLYAPLGDADGECITGICPLASLQAEALVIPESMRQAIADLARREVARVAALMDTGRQQGELHFETSPEIAARVLLATYKGALLYARGDGIAAYRQTMEAALAGLVARA